MSELENDEVNLQLCAVDTFSWSPETQEQILAEWNDWRRGGNPGHSCDECGKTFTRSNDLKRHTKRVHTGERAFTCDQCDKSFATLTNPSFPTPPRSLACYTYATKPRQSDSGLVQLSSKLSKYGSTCQLHTAHI